MMKIWNIIRVLSLFHLTLTQLQQVSNNEKNFDDSSCPENFMKFNNICYVTSSTQCPFYDYLSSEDTKNLVNNINNPKNIKKSFASLDPTSKPQEVSLKFCAYLSSSDISYCQQFDRICTNNTNRDTRNCHCRNRKKSFFCELDCDKKIFNKTICKDCKNIYHSYGRPSLTLHFNNNMFLEIKSHLKLLHATDDDLVYCYADGVRLTKNNLVKHNETYTHKYYSILFRKLHRSRYWCEAFVLYSNEVKKIQSNFLILPSRNTGLIQTNNKKDIHILLDYDVCSQDTTQMFNFKLTWSETRAGLTVTSQELCLQNDSQPVTRTCLSVQDGMIWTAVQGKCVENSGEIFGSTYTIPLHYLSQSKEDSQTKLTQLKQLVKTMKNPVIADVYFAAKIFEEIPLSSGKYNINDLIEVASDIMDLDREILRKAQFNGLNSTDKILYTIDNALVMNNFNLKSNGKFSNNFFQIKTRNIYIQVSNTDDYITGAAFYENNDNDMEIIPMYNDTDIDNLQFDNLKLAAFVTDIQMREMREFDYLENSTLVIVLFRRDSLFNEQNRFTTTGYQVGFYISNSYIDYMIDYGRILIKPMRKYRATLNCAYWMYGNQYPGRYTPIMGEWISDSLEPQSINDILLCKFWHMTHFGLLVGLEETIPLSTITAIGCALSMLGALGVIITAITYQTWRENSGTKILLNFVVTIVLENCVLTVGMGVDSYKNITACIFVGSLLHYGVVAQFSWMLIIGYLQYQRYVTVFFTVNKRFIIGASVVAWGLPIIPVAVVLTVNKEYYLQDNYCYLVQKPLYFGVFLPVSIILTVNITIFALILKSLCSKSNATDLKKDKLSFLHLKLIILLFFLLGLYWIFGISARFFQSFALDYVFCISAALQGLVIFLYFIIFNKLTRNFWFRHMKNSEMMTAMQTWLHRNNDTVDQKMTDGCVTQGNRHRKSVASGSSMSV